MTDVQSSLAEFEAFDVSDIDVGDVTLRVRHAGSGPPLLLLHGYPQTHKMWGKIAPALARDFTVVAPDLRGYGASSKPATTPDHEPYSKRAMARDAVALMRHFGFTRFDLAGHDRGGRVGYRLALDAPEIVSRLSVLDIVPTGDVWRLADARFAMGYWHWPFLAQPHPFPENVIMRDSKAFFFPIGGHPAFAAFEDYARAVADPLVVHAMCEDYRAGATYDHQLDSADRGVRKIGCPVQVLWGSKGAIGQWYDVLDVWTAWADDLRGEALDCGHFLPEESPLETLDALRAFHLA